MSHLTQPQYRYIHPQSSSEELLEVLADLLEKQEGEKKWVIKIRGEFRGRGIATLKINLNKCGRTGVQESR